MKKRPAQGAEEISAVSTAAVLGFWGQSFLRRNDENLTAAMVAFSLVRSQGRGNSEAWIGFKPAQ